MKTTIISTAVFATVACIAIASPFDANTITNRDVNHHPTVDDTAMRLEREISVEKPYHENEPGKGPTVDDTSTRTEWVASYKGPHDENQPGKGPTVDDTSTRTEWVASYKGPHDEMGVAMPSPGAWAASDHWLPRGPGYLDINELEMGYHAHLLVMHDSSSWLHSSFRTVKRYFKPENA